VLHGLHHVRPPTQALDPQDFSEAYFNYERVSLQRYNLSSLGVTGLPEGPTACCPVCANVEGACYFGCAAMQHAFLSHSATHTSHPPHSPPLLFPSHLTHAGGPEYRVTLCGDAVTEHNHFSNCGTAAKTITPHVRSYFGETDQQVQQLESSGQLSLKALRAMAQQQQQQERGEGGEEEGSCSTVVRCGREESNQRSKPLDILGICGFVCQHGNPCLGTFVNMPAPEQFAYYFKIIDYLLDWFKPTALALNVDFACKLGPSYLRYNPLAAGLAMMVGWMHGASHTPACQIQNCSRNLVGTAHAHGETMEGVWSILKVRQPVIRHMLCFV
jgi:hypothetical protein